MGPLAALVGVIVAAVLTLGLGSLWYNAQLKDALQTANDRGLDAQAKHVKAGPISSRLATPWIRC